MSHPFHPLDSGGEERTEVIFYQALRQPPEERGAFLESECNCDPQLRAVVEAMLRDHAEAGTFLSAGGPLAAALEAELSHSPREQAGGRIGPYKLLQQIGEGGCGVVWMAEQEQPVRRRVALKVIKLGMDTKQVIARFEAERQALALMEHPNIARVLDAGATDTGSPYFVMELVRGIKITTYCDQNNLPTEQRLELFTQVCHAVQHAHQKGIIHRDLKPSNILVTSHDGVPVPKVIDFGIAKATTGQQLTDKTIFTAFEQFIGTPAYMSPEQAEMSGLDIDTRSDIYALGVLLYELLTGRTPFDAKELLASGLDAMRRTIREQEPVRPSTMLSTMLAADQTTVAKHHQTEAIKLTHSLRGDLDWIVMKALEKDRTRRYESASSLAQEIQRHLNNEPVTARPPGNFYRFRKLVRRNKVAFAAGAAVLVALVAGLGISTWMFFKEKDARKRAVAAEQEQSRLRQLAETQEKIATTESGKSQQVARFLQDMLNGVGPRVAMGRDTTLLREVLDKTVERLERELANQPAVEAELRATIGSVYEDLREMEKAGAMYHEALAIRRELYGSDHPLISDCLLNLSRVSYRLGRLEEAESLAREAVVMRIKLLGEEHVSVAAALTTLGWAVTEQGRWPEGQSIFREALAIRRKSPDHEDPDLAALLTAMAQNMLWQSREPEAEKLLREAVEIYKTKRGREHPDVIGPLHFLGRCLIGQNRPAEAEMVSREALVIANKVFGEGEGRTIRELSVLCSSVVVQGRRDEAQAMILKTPEPAQTLGQVLVMLRFTGQQEKAASLLPPNLEVLRAEVLRNPGVMLDALKQIADALYREGCFADAESFYLIWADGRPLNGADNEVTAVGGQASLARCLADWAWAERERGAASPELQTQIHQRACEAERLLRNVIAIRQAKNARPSQIEETRSRLGGALIAVAVTDPSPETTARGAKLAEAETLLLKANKAILGDSNVEVRHRRDSLIRIVRLYEVLERKEKVLEWQQALSAFDSSEANAVDEAKEAKIEWVAPAAAREKHAGPDYGVGSR